MEQISVVICTHNEAKNIANCIKSLKGITDIVVDDDNSTDKTVEIAKSLGATVYQRQEWRDTITSI
jgi:glycosyltransferase involved in cell wall biosynthesis